MEQKHEKPIENVKIPHCWHHMYFILSTFLSIPACYFYDLKMCPFDNTVVAGRLSARKPI